MYNRGSIRVLSLLVVAAMWMGLPLPARAGGPQRPIGDIGIFATLPYPGNPGGLAVTGRTLYVDTSASNFDRPFDGSASIFRYDLQTGRLGPNGTNPVVGPLALPGQDMGLAGIALDSAGRPDVADLNGP